MDALPGKPKTYNGTATDATGSTKQEIKDLESKSSYTLKLSIQNLEPTDGSGNTLFVKLNEDTVPVELPPGEAVDVEGVVSFFYAYANAGKTARWQAIATLPFISSL